MRTINNTISIGIIGGGPRGCVILERIISYIEYYKLNVNQFNIVIFDPNSIGGSLVYNVESDNILLNTISSQITLYSNESSVKFGPLYKGPSLHEYSKEYFNNIELNGFEYLPRKVFHSYLNDFLQKQVQRLKHMGISFQIINDEVIDIDIDKNMLQVKLASLNEIINLNDVVICTGHGINKWSYKDNRFSEILSVNSINKIFKNSDNILIKGMGLVAFDTISELTEGLGGKFYYDKEILTYLSSGKEPRIYLSSRSGVPLLGKPKRNYCQDIYIPKYFTFDNIRAILNTKKQLDFDKDVLPLLINELSLKFRNTDSKIDFNIENIFQQEKLILTDNSESFKDSFQLLLNGDINECNLGIGVSAIKSSSEIIRDLRDILRMVVEESKWVFSPNPSKV